MPYIQLSTNDIVIDIPDVNIGQTVIKRTATLFDMDYNTHNKQVVLRWLVKHYANNADGTKGDYLPFIQDWAKESIADNTTMCDVTNGQPIYKTHDTGEVEKDANGNPILDANGNQVPIMDYDPAINYSGQYDVFFNMAQAQPVLVNPMIIQFGQLVQSWDK